MENFNGWQQLEIMPDDAREWANRLAADHEEALQMNGERDLFNLANKCISELNAGRNVSEVITEWNALAKVVGFGMMWTKGNYTASFAAGILEGRKTRLVA